MSKYFYTLYATDKDIYDLLLSGKQKVTENYLRDLAKKRRVFFSNRLGRSELVDRISMLPQSYVEVSSMVRHREMAPKSERTTSVKIDEELSLDDILEVVKEYKDKNHKSEDVSYKKRGGSAFEVDIGYSEYDYSKTRLMQRLPKEANIDFTVDSGATVIRMPANDKARSVVAYFQKRMEEKRSSPLKVKEIEVYRLTSPDQRTKFFTDLISKMEGYSLYDVTSLRVSSFSENEDRDDIEEEEEAAEEAASKMMAVVRKASFSGSNVIASDEYQKLNNSVFFITSIRWMATCKNYPYDRIGLEAGFDDPEGGRGFRYKARVAKRKEDGSYGTQYGPLDEKDKKEIFSLIEKTAEEVIRNLIDPDDA